MMIYSTQRRSGALKAAALGLMTGLALLTSAPVRAATMIPAGMVLHTQLTSPDINSKNAHVGDQFTMLVVSPYPSGDGSFSGATVYGHVASVRSAGQGRKPILQLSFDHLTLANGRTAALSASVTQLQTVAENTTARKGLGAGVGAAVGSQTIGRLIGGTAGAIIGIGGGAAAGYAYGANAKANVSIVKGASATLTATSTTHFR